jgi:hypothetical protein
MGLVSVCDEVVAVDALIPRWGAYLVHTLFYKGKKRLKIPTEMRKRIDAQCRGARLTRMPKARHAPLDLSTEEVDSFAAASMFFQRTPHRQVHFLPE